jgi:hypothetical protein
MKEAWLFGQLNSVSDGGDLASKTDEDARFVGERLQKLLKGVEKL